VATLADLATVYRRLPKNSLDDPLADLSTAVKRVLRDELEDSGYTLTEIQARFGNDIGAYTLRDVVSFAASRRRKPRYDAANDRIICDGAIQSCRNIQDVERWCSDDADWQRLLALRDTLLAEWDANQKLIRLSQRLPGLPQWERSTLLALVGQAGYFFDKIRPDTFPTTGLLDDANRADDATPPPGAGWGGMLYSAGGQFQVLTNQFAPLGGGTSTDYWGTLFGTDQEAFVDIATKSTVNGSATFVDLRVVAPGTSAWDGYEIETIVVAGADECRIYRVDNEAWTQLGAMVNQEFASGESLGGEAIGSALTLYRKSAGSWASVLSRTDATYAPASSYIGMGSYEASTTEFRLDNFSGGTVVAAGGGFAHSQGVIVG
jgi:hypothetical protein